jgi:GntR family transcriptional regulator, uxu operon transcriptional repressor
LRLYIGEKELDHNERLPPERTLSEALGVSRAELRRALNKLEDDGLIWRHVGRGTFVGSRSIFNLDDVDYLRKLASPKKIIEARMAIEPELACLSASNGTKVDFDEIELCDLRCVAARDWRTYEAWDNNFHLVSVQSRIIPVLVEWQKSLGQGRGN